jgi:hypothetical protein
LRVAHHRLYEHRPSTSLVTIRSSFFSPRQKNLWVTDTVEQCREARLAEPANPLSDAGLRFVFVARCLSEPA